MTKTSRILSFAIRNVFRRPTILFLALAGIAVGCGLIFSLRGLSAGINQEINNVVSEIKNLMWIEASGGNAFNESIVTLIKNNQSENLEYVYPQVETIFTPEEIGSKNPLAYVTVFGIEEKYDKAILNLNNHIVEGKPLDWSKNQCVVGPLVAKNYGVKVGDIFNVSMITYIPQSMQVYFWNNETQDFEAVNVTLEPRKVVRYQEVEVVGIFGFETKTYDEFVYMPIEFVRTHNNMKPNEYTTILVKVKNENDLDKMARELKNLLTRHKIEATVVKAIDAIKGFQELVNTFDLFLVAVSLTAGIAGGMGIAITMLISVIERLPEFGVFKAVGWRNRNILQTVIIESGILGFAGAMLGTAIGLVGIQLLNEIFAGQMTAIVTWHIVLEVTVFGIAVGIVGGVYPALRASRVKPIEILQGM